MVVVVDVVEMPMADLGRHFGSRENLISHFWLDTVPILEALPVGKAKLSPIFYIG